MYSVLPGVEIVLASGSPRRRELLAEAGITCRIESSSVDETEREGESPQAMVERLAREKAAAVAQRYPHAWVLGADTTVAIGGQILGKPLSSDDAVRMVTLLQGTTHEVWSAFAFVASNKNIVRVESALSQVTMVPLTKREVHAYVATGESMDKAGAYAMQGRGASLIHSLKGSYTNVVGLNISRVLEVAKEFGLIEPIVGR